MSFVRKLDESFPRVWDSWEADGKSWTIQDLEPEDDERAVEIMMEYFCKEETLCMHSGLNDDVASEAHSRELYRKCFSRRTTLGCYVQINGVKKLVGLSSGVVQYADDVPEENEDLLTTAHQNMVNTFIYLESKVNMFECFGLDKVFVDLGVVLVKDYRGIGLGVRLLNAREPLCRHLGVRGSYAVFTSVSSQKMGVLCGYETIASVTLKELAEAGLKYPQDENSLLIIAVKRYE